MLMISFVFGCLVNGHQPNAANSSQENPAGTYPVYWYERDLKKEAFIKSDEFAVFTDKNKTLQIDEALLDRCLGLGTDIKITEKSDTLVFLEMSGPISIDTIKHCLSSMEESDTFKGASPVFYVSSAGNPADRFVLTGQIIVQFPPDYSGDKISEIEKTYDIQRIKTFSFAANTFLYQAENAMAALEKANSIYESGASVYAYPDRLRYRSTRP
jgi:hypothetical protein